MNRSLLQDFRRFAQEKTFADFEVDDGVCERVIAAFFGDRADRFQAIGMHGSHSPMALWFLDDGRSAIVWIDSEGAVSVIAEDLSSFLSLLPYGTGFIYDLFSRSRMSKAAIKAAFKEQAAEFPDHGAFVDWLAERGLAPAKDPAALVKAAIAAFPDPREWVV